ncbi:MAG TPA: hypothetical protein PLP37_06455 [Clostridiales bacterium]|nr:hypothetical protein [Clostridiales bacterium]
MRRRKNNKQHLYYNGVCNSQKKNPYEFEYNFTYNKDRTAVKRYAFNSGNKVVNETFQECMGWLNLAKEGIDVVFCLLGG